MPDPVGSETDVTTNAVVCTLACASAGWACIDSTRAAAATASGPRTAAGIT